MEGLMEAEGDLDADGLILAEGEREADGLTLADGELIAKGAKEAAVIAQSASPVPPIVKPTVEFPAGLTGLLSCPRRIAGIVDAKLTVPRLIASAVIVGEVVAALIPTEKMIQLFATVVNVN